MNWMYWCMSPSRLDWIWAMVWSSLNMASTKVRRTCGFFQSAASAGLRRVRGE